MHRVLKPGGTFWLSIGDEFAAELKVAAEHQVGFHTRSWVVWYYTFGVNCTRKFSRSHAHLFHFVKDENNFTFNAEDPQIRVPSARALVYADKRANPAGRLPDDTWIVRPAADDSWVLRPQDLPEGFQPTDDTWYYARVAGTFKERQGFHGCQMPEQLLGPHRSREQQPGRHRARPVRRQRHDAGRGQEAWPQLDGLRTVGRIHACGDRAIECDRRRRRTRRSGRSDRQCASTVNGRQAGQTSRTESNQSVSRAATQPVAGKDATAASRRREARLREMVRDAIVDSFYAAHEGHSIDWLLGQSQLQTAFHESCRETGLIGSPADWNRELLRFRKTGEFPKRGADPKGACGRRRTGPLQLRRRNCLAAGERQVSRRTSLDEIFCDPVKAAYFDRTAKRFCARLRAGSISLGRAAIAQGQS